MTVVAESGRRAGWRGRLVWLALALSLTLNVCFIGGLVWTRMRFHQMASPMERIQHLADALNLNADQRAAFGQFLRVIRQRGRSARGSNEALLDRSWAEIAKAEPDDAALAQLGQQIHANRDAFEQEASQAMLAFIKTLSPEQRSQLAAIAKSRPDEPMRRVYQMIAP